ncbi:MAG: type I 3-dehydroquinate dehydratase [Eubacteriales bacterium]|nr:type I 3-dehydroquinate dehydratase [Eubacteriales bacterium]
MKRRFTEAGSPIVIGVVKEPTAEDAIRYIQRSEAMGVNAFDLHLSLLVGENGEIPAIRRICGESHSPVLAVHYNYAPGAPSGRLHDTEEQRFEKMACAVEQGGASGIDLPAYFFCSDSRASLSGADPERYPFAKKSPREVVLEPSAIEKQKYAIDRIHRAGGEVLMSCHTGVYLDTQELVSLALLMAERNPDLIKLVIPVESREQVAQSFMSMLALQKAVPIKVHLHCAGKLGRITRYCSPYFGAAAVFAADPSNSHSDPEQLVPEKFFDFFREIRVDSK